MFFFRGQDSGGEHPCSLQPSPHRHHRPGPEPERPRQPGGASAGRHGARQEDQTPGGPGGRDQAGLDALRRPLGHHRLRVGPDQRDDEDEEERPPCRKSATAGEHQHSVQHISQTPECIHHKTEAREEKDAS